MTIFNGLLTTLYISFKCYVFLNIKSSVLSGIPIKIACISRKQPTSVLLQYFRLLFQAMVVHGRVELLAHPLSQKYLEMKWHSYGKYFHLVNLLFYCIFLAFVTLFAYLLMEYVDLHNTAKTMMMMKDASKHVVNGTEELHNATRNTGNQC